MRAVVQRVSEASVHVNGRVVGRIGGGLVVLLGVQQDDSGKEAEYLADKIANLRIFPDSHEVMNLSILEAGGEILVVSQFTLFGDCRKGRRPSYAKAAGPDKANDLYLHLVSCLRKAGLTVATGEFQAMMKVSLVNDGPVTLLLDSARLF